MKKYDNQFILIIANKIAAFSSSVILGGNYICYYFL